MLSRPDYDRAIARIRELGWYIKIQPEANGIVDSVHWFENLDMPVLIDHMARPGTTCCRSRVPIWTLHDQPLFANVFGPV